LWAGWKGIGKYQTALGDLRDESRQAQGELGSAKLELLQSDEAMQNLDRWQEESLPEDPEVAQTEYRAWLVDRLGESGLKFNNVRRVGARSEGEAYTAITYTAHADGKLDQITRFLHTFYDSPQLHKITVLKLTPMPEGGELAMDVTIESLIVHGTTRKEGIAEGSSGRLALENVDAYVESIKGRNLFTQYTPPPPHAPSPPPRPLSRPRHGPPSRRSTTPSTPSSRGLSATAIATRSGSMSGPPARASTSTKGMLSRWGCSAGGSRRSTR
jgi:hypothetical protein